MDSRLHCSCRALPGAPTQRGRLPRVHWSQLALALVTLAVVGPALSHAIELWSTQEEFSLGFLVVPAAALLVWRRRTALRRSLGSGASAGLPIVLAALMLYLLAYRLAFNFLAGLAIIPLLWGMVIYLWGWGAGRVLAFPVGFLAFGLGLHRGLIQSAGVLMQGVTGLGATALASALGVSVAQDGLVLQSAQFAFIVGEPCSGMSSLLALLALATLWTQVTQGPLLGPLALVLSVLPLVVVANIVRVTLVLLVASWFGQDAAVGFFHSVSSLLLFALALSGLVVVSWIIGCRRFTPAIGS